MTQSDGGVLRMSLSIIQDGDVREQTKQHIILNYQSITTTYVNIRSRAG